MCYIHFVKNTIMRLLVSLVILGLVACGNPSPPVWLLRLSQSYGLTSEEKFQLYRGYGQLERSPRLLSQTVEGAYEAVGMTGDKTALLNSELVGFVGEALQVTEITPHSLGQILQKAQGLGIDSPRWEQFLESINKGDQVLGRVGRHGEKGVPTYDRMFHVFVSLKTRGVKVAELYDILIVQYTEIEGFMISQGGDPEIPYKFLIAVLEHPEKCSELTGQPWADVHAHLMKGELLPILTNASAHFGFATRSTQGSRSPAAPD